jgi:hypothetical protein
MIYANLCKLQHVLVSVKEELVVAEAWVCLPSTLGHDVHGDDCTITTLQTPADRQAAAAAVK